MRLDHRALRPTSLPVASGNEFTNGAAGYGQHGIDVIILKDLLSGCFLVTPALPHEIVYRRESCSGSPTCPILLSEQFNMSSINVHVVSGKLHVIDTCSFDTNASHYISNSVKQADYYTYYWMRFLQRW
jgi:hypothetical protein